MFEINGYQWSCVILIIININDLCKNVVNFLFEKVIYSGKKDKSGETHGNFFWKMGMNPELSLANTREMKQ